MLQTAVAGKLAELAREFDQLRDASSALPFWRRQLWEAESVTLKDWVLVDAWYRSRCLELPQSGEAMVPGLDMANHSRAATAYYEEEDDDIVLAKRPSACLLPDGEVTISYGDAKSAAEMLFSYGFVGDAEHGHAQEMTLPLSPLADDPLAKAKVYVYGAAPTVKLMRRKGGVDWESPFAFLMCLNEEDGLQFRVLQDVAGHTQLKLFWQGEDVTAQAGKFGSLVDGYPLASVLRLRAVVVLHELVTTQLEQIASEPSRDEAGQLVEAGRLLPDRALAAERLRGIEAAMLKEAAQTLEEQVSLRPRLPQSPAPPPLALFVGWPRWRAATCSKAGPCTSVTGVGGGGRPARHYPQQNPAQLTANAHSLTHGRRAIS